MENVDYKKIFIVIGFPKCGTSSLNEYFLLNNVKSIHYKKGHLRIGKLISMNKKLSKLLLSGLSDYDAITQIDVSEYPLLIYPQLTDTNILMRQYPNAKFILNIRNVDNWIKSVNNWGALRQRYIQSNLPYLPKGKGKTDNELRKWYNDHTDRMLELFKNEPDRLIIVNIENADIEKLNNFCNLYNVKKFPFVKIVKK